jgi:hypothetical protein
MKLLILALCLPLLIGCAGTTGTTVYNPKTGKKMLSTSADASVMSLSAKGDFYASKLNHSRPITARAAGAAAILRGAGAAVGEGGSVFIRP